MSAAGAGDVWAVGAVSSPTSSDVIRTALVDHFDGTSWQVVTTPTIPAAQFKDSNGVTLSGVAAVSHDDVWAVGSYATPAPGSQFVSWSQTLVEHWDGTAWRTVPAPDLTAQDELRAIAVVRPDDIWAVGDATYEISEPPTPGLPNQPISSEGLIEPLAEHWDGSRWSIVPVPPVGVDPGDVAGVLARARDNSLTFGIFSAVRAVSAKDVWAVGDLSGGNNPQRPDTTFVDHWDGTSWSNVAVPDQPVAELGHNASDDLYAVDGSATTGLWAVGAAAPLGTLTLRRAGSSWTIVPSPQTGYRGYFGNVAVIGPSNVWAAGDSIAHWDGHTWTDIPTVNGTSVGPLEGMAAVSANDLWFAGATSFIHYTCGT